MVVVATPQTGAPDEMAVTAPGGSTPIVIQLGSVIEVPTLSAWGAAGLALLLLGAGLWAIRQRKPRRVAALLLLLGVASAVYAATVTLDGLTGDWAPGTQVATDSAADGSLGSNMVALFAQVDNTNDPAYSSLEPKNKGELVLALLPQVFAWARAAGPTQPLTTGLWRGGDWSKLAELSVIDRVQLALSDVITFHSYDPPPQLEARIRQLQGYKRPIICTE